MATAFRRFCSKIAVPGPQLGQAAELVPSSDPLSPPIHKQRLLKAAILGRPNAGKSTLVNQLVGKNVAGVSPKVHTTRCGALGVYTEGEHQVVLLDTPGVISYGLARKLNMSKSFMTAPKQSTDEADLMLVIVDCSSTLTRFKLDPQLLYIMEGSNLPSALLINKVLSSKFKCYIHTSEVDILQHKHLLLKIADSLKEQAAHSFNEVFMISALTGDGIDRLKDFLLDCTKPKKWEYDCHTFTDQSQEMIVEEAIREKLFLHLHREIPYIIKQRLIVWEERDDKLYILKNITCAKNSQVSIVIGPEGKTIHRITEEAQAQIESLLGRPVELQLNVHCK